MCGMHLRFGSIYVSVISAIGLVEASNYTITQAAGHATTSVPLIIASPEPGARFATSCDASCAATVTRPTYNSSDFWISISYTSGSHFAESGPVVHSTVTDGLHPGPTTTEQAVGIVTKSSEVVDYGITLPLFGPLGPRPTGHSSGQTEQNQGTGSEPVVALPIIRSTDHGPTSSTAEAKSRSQITFGGQTYTANPSSQFVIGSQTLQPGGPAITHDGHAISLGTSASNVVIDGSTDTTSHLLAKTTLILTAAPVLTLDDQPVTAISASEYIVGGETLIPGGPAATFRGTRISLAPSASDIIIIGSSTEALGSVILGGFGPSRAATSTVARNANATATEPEAFTGGAVPAKKTSSWGAATLLVVIGLVMG
ncbi:MAG: hypothetical protein Q9195_009391 [Heterodermia aff. obscurata]